MNEKSLHRGQVLLCYSDSDKALLWANSYEEWLEMIVDDWIRRYEFRNFYEQQLIIHESSKRPSGIVHCASILSHEKLKRSLITSWGKLFEYRKTHGIRKPCVGATDEEIKVLINCLDRSIPEALIESLKVCNNTNVFDTDSTKESRCKGTGWLLTTSEIVERVNEKSRRKEVTGDICYYDNWLPIYTWMPDSEEDDLYDDICEAVIQMDEKSPNYGKVFFWGFSRGPAIWANSYEEWLEMIVYKTIKNSRLTLEYFENHFKKNYELQNELNSAFYMLIYDKKTFEEVIDELGLSPEFMINELRNMVYMPYHFNLKYWILPEQLETLHPL